ncbi:hypothetical protein VTO42DRAFT_5248 [Malbranchea cinnamomea]
MSPRPLVRLARPKALLVLVWSQILLYLPSPTATSSHPRFLTSKLLLSLEPCRTSSIDNAFCCYLTFPTGRQIPLLSKITGASDHAVRFCPSAQATLRIGLKVQIPRTRYSCNIDLRIFFGIAYASLCAHRVQGASQDWDSLGSTTLNMSQCRPSALSLLSSMMQRIHAKCLISLSLLIPAFLRLGK